MGLYAIKLPDIGEGVAEAEIVEWCVGIGDLVKQDEVVVAVMTDKATVEIPSVATGTVVWRGGEVGDKLAVGSDLLRLEVAGEGNVADHKTPRGGGGLNPGGHDRRTRRTVGPTFRPGSRA